MKAKLWNCAGERKQGVTINKPQAHVPFFWLSHTTINVWWSILLIYKSCHSKHRHLDLVPLPAVNSYFGKTDPLGRKWMRCFFSFFFLLFPLRQKGFSYALIPPLAASIYNRYHLLNSYSVPGNLCGDFPWYYLNSPSS